MAQSVSAYPVAQEEAAPQRATFAVIVDNEPGVLHRVVGLFAARGYNIESLTVAETDHAVHTSRITIVTRGAPNVLAQIKAQLERMVQTRQVRDVGGDPEGVERELALVKVKGVAADRVEAKIDKFEALMRPLGLVEVSRTGVLAIRRGAARE